MRPHAEPLAPRILVHSDPQLVLPEDDPVNFASVFRFVRRRWRILIAWMAVAICAAVCFIVLSPSHYTAYTTLLLQASDARPQGDAVNALLGVDPATYVYSQIELIQSDEVLEHVIARSHLMEDPEFTLPATGLPNELMEWARSVLYPQAPHKKLRRQEIMMRLRRALSIQRLGISDAVQISFTARSPDRAAAIANLVAKSYINGRIEQKLRAREDSANALRERLAKLRTKMYDVGASGQSPAGGGSADQARERFRELQDSAEAYRNLYTAFLQREYTSPAADPASSSGRIITPAKPPVYRTSPRIPLVLAIAIVLGGGIGFGHALFRHLADRVIGTVADLEAFTHFDRIWHVRRERRYRWHRDRVAAKSFQLAYALKSNRVGDALRKVAVRLQLSQAGDPRKTIGVVACNSGAGASTIAFHLASMFAEAGRKVLLLDTNWRKKPMPGTTSDPEPQSDGTVLKQKGTIQCGAHSLDVLAIRVFNATSDLIASRTILDTLSHQRAKHDYDYIVVDFHSTEETADMESALGAMEKIVVVAEASRTALDNLKTALRPVPSDKVSSLLLNKA